MRMGISLKKRFALFLALFLPLFVCDFILKFWAYNYVNEPILVFRTPFGIDFLIQCVTNCGGAWGMLASMQIPLLIFRMVVVIALSLYLFKYKHGLFFFVFLTLVIIGAFGNVFDSFYYGFVIDMLHFLFWGRSFGIFNFADALIFIGAFGLILFAKTKREKMTDEAGL
jgi:signal peptidase II